MELSHYFRRLLVDVKLLAFSGHKAEFPARSRSLLLHCSTGWENGESPDGRCH